MVLLTMIGRPDGTLLCASVDEKDVGGTSSLGYHKQAKSLLKTIDPNSLSRMTFETDNAYVFHCLVENNICYLLLCHKTFSNKLAFSYLEDIATEFKQRYRNLMYSATRDYSCIEFDVYLKSESQKLNAAKSRRNIHMLSDELQGVQKIMAQSLGDVLQRGVAISDLDSKASNLSLMSQNYRKNANLLNTKATFVKVVVGSILIISIVLYFWFL